MPSSLQLPAIGFGCDPLGGHNWGTIEPGAIMAAVPRALDMGVNLFDTADCYGDGLSEQRLGDALGPRRPTAIVATKFGVRIDADGRTFVDNDPQWIRTAVENSLRRLRTDYIDVYQLHWWDRRTPFDVIFDTLSRLMDEGKIRAFGTTNVTLREIGLSSATELPQGFATTSMEFSLVHSVNREAISAMCTGGPDRPSFLAWGALGGGILTGKYTKATDLHSSDRRLKRTDSHFAGERLARNLRIVELCRVIAAAHGPTVKTSQVALQWVSRSLGFGTCLVGIKSVSNLEDAVGAFAFRLSDSEVLRLNTAATTP